MYMMTTINVSIPTDMYKRAKNAIPSGGYASISELIREALRKMLYTTNQTEPTSFEKKVIDAESSSSSDDIILNTDSEMKSFFLGKSKSKKKI
jgi:Arc/MetJ-type ribon-helix-helix transcriptional regulator